MLESFRKTGPESPEYTHGILRDAWIIAEEPTSEELDQLSSELGLERDLLQDARDPFEVPRIQEEGGVLYVYMRIPQSDGERIATSPILLALGMDFILTVWDKQPTFMEKYLGNTVRYSTDNRSELLLRLWGEVNSVYERSTMTIGRLIRSTMADMNYVQNKDIMSMVTHEGVLNDFLAALVPMDTQLKSLSHSQPLGVQENNADLYEDISLQSGQLIETSKSVLKTTVNYRNAYSVIVNNNLNAIVKFLTAATVVLALPTAIFSFYGMNIQLPLNGNPAAWPIIASVTLIVSVLVIVLFVRKRLF